MKGRCTGSVAQACQEHASPWPHVRGCVSWPCLCRGANTPLCRGANTPLCGLDHSSQRCNLNQAFIEIQASGSFQKMRRECVRGPLSANLGGEVGPRPCAVVHRAIPSPAVSSDITGDPTQPGEMRNQVVLEGSPEEGRPEWKLAVPTKPEWSTGAPAEQSLGFWGKRNRPRQRGWSTGYAGRSLGGTLPWARGPTAHTPGLGFHPRPRSQEKAWALQSEGCSGDITASRCSQPGRGRTGTPGGRCARGGGRADGN